MLKLVPEVTVNNFPGLAPNLTALDNRAVQADNVDFSGGGVRSTRASSFVEAGHSGEIAYFNDTWRSGRTNYIPTDIEGIPALISKRNGEWRLNINDVKESQLWIPAPTGVTVESAILPQPTGMTLNVITVGSITSGAYEYFCRFRELDANGNTERESPLSAPLDVGITNDGSGVVINRPVISGLNAGNNVWVLYRRKAGENYAREVSTAQLTVPSITDKKPANELGASEYPEISANGLSAVEYQYVFVWVRELAGWVTESTPSQLFPAIQDEEGVKITLTEDPPTGVSSWRIYRISLGYDPTTTFQLVTELQTQYKTYTDTKKNPELGAALASSYRADNGALVTAGVPDTMFDGMAGPFNGFFVGWIDRDLYLSEPGNPTWWPGAYVVQANANIVGITQVGNSIAVVTDDGVQYGFGATPDSFVLGQGMFGTGGSHRTAIDKGFYLGHDGVYQIGENAVTRISSGFSEDYFLSLNLSNPFLITENEQLLLTFDAGGIKYDFRSSKWSEIDDAYVLASLYPKGGEIYAVKEEAIIKLNGSSEYDHMDYEVAGLTFGGANFKRIDAVRCFGVGVLNIRLKDIDGTILADDTVDLNSSYRPDHYIYMPVWAEVEGVRMQISGKGELRSALFELMEANTEE